MWLSAYRHPPQSLALKRFLEGEQLLNIIGNSEYETRSSHLFDSSYVHMLAHRWMRASDYVLIDGGDLK